MILKAVVGHCLMLRRAFNENNDDRDSGYIKSILNYAYADVEIEKKFSWGCLVNAFCLALKETTSHYFPVYGDILKARQTLLTRNANGHSVKESPSKTDIKIDSQLAKIYFSEIGKTVSDKLKTNKLKDIKNGKIGNIFFDIIEQEKKKARA